MAKIRHDEIIEAALALLSEGGLDALTTRRLAQRLGVESSSLYWHVKDKATLLGEMADIILTRYHTIDTPQDTSKWDSWFIDNARSFRYALLAYPDGAMLHAGSTPNNENIVHIMPKIEYLIRVGFPEIEAQMAMLTMSQFTIGCVMEEQTRNKMEASNLLTKTNDNTGVETLTSDVTDNINTCTETSFEFGISLIVDGMRNRIRTNKIPGNSN